MIFTVFQIAVWRLWNNKQELLLMFVMPIIFFSIFAVIFSRGIGDGMATVKIAFIDDDRTELTSRTIGNAASHPDIESLPGVGQTKPEWNIQKLAKHLITEYSVGLVVYFPKGFTEAQQIAADSQNPPQKENQGTIRILNEGTNPVSRQVVSGILIQALAQQKLAERVRSNKQAVARQLASATALGEVNEDSLIPSGAFQFASHRTPLKTDFSPREQAPNRIAGPVTEEPTQLAPAGPETDHQFSKDTDISADSLASDQALSEENVFAIDKHNPKIAMYAAGIAVMFLLFSASGAGGSLLDEYEAGTLDRLLCSQISLSQLLAGKWLFIALMGVVQLTTMFIWGQLVFGIDLWGHLGPFMLLAGCTAGASASLALCLAVLCKTRNQLNGVSVVIILTMSALGGSMVPRYVMSENMQKLGLLTFNGWALDGFQKVFWYDLPITAIRLEVMVMMGIALALAILARCLAWRWAVR